MKTMNRQDLDSFKLQPAEFQEMLATDLVPHCHQALQAALLTQDYKRIGRALDALGVAYGVMNNQRRTCWYCAIATRILREAGDPAGAAMAFQHMRAAAWLLQQVGKLQQT